MKNTKENYAEIMKLLKKHKNEICFDVDELQYKADKHLFGLSLVEKYGFEIDPKSIRSIEYQELISNVYLSTFGDSGNKSISWSDDGRQPKNEKLIVIKFPTGAFVFGGDYPTDVFSEFFNELKSYKPKYSDTANHSLYFTLKNGAKVFNEYKSIFKKYIEISRADYNKREASRLRAQAEKLESAQS